MKMNKAFYILIPGIAIIYSCQKLYNPATTVTNANVLVVEGLINTGTDTTKIKLSRTVIIANKTTANSETKAVVTVEDAQNNTHALTETAKGIYASAGLNLDPAKQYRLRIKTSNGNTYLSDFVDVKITPVIDSVGFKTDGAQLQIYANTHDDTNNTRYYKYDYSETWQFNTKYSSFFVTNGIDIEIRSQDITTCFAHDTSANTTINSTAALSQDVVYQFPLTTIDASSEKIETKYSILLTQQALTKDAYAFWQNMKKNTEQLGSIFDAQPSQLTGNVHNAANPAEPVIGYVSAGTTQQKRIYITKAQLPSTWHTIYPYNCGLDSAYTVNPVTKSMDVAKLLIPKTSDAIIIQPFDDHGGGYLFTDAFCADCTIRGFKQQPAFWK
jgi:hypothetical protein